MKFPGTAIALALLSASTVSAWKIKAGSAEHSGEGSSQCMGIDIPRLGAVEVSGLAPGGVIRMFADGGCDFLSAVFDKNGVQVVLDGAGSFVVSVPQ
ncbi:hypothetical protein FQN54_000776 [Arachnomyces sp. PD_36]|nr:hypothetical protein FQN54_000776 [Arachnomyces sp. PD_36]